LFAIAGAAAFLCGIQRNALSIVVIMMEATQTASFVLPIIVSSAVAKWVGDRFSDSLNHTSMHRRGVPFLEPTMCAKQRFPALFVFHVYHSSRTELGRRTSRQSAAQ
jgi:H+/Cl- antiporter ClcA